MTIKAKQISSRDNGRVASSLDDGPRRSRSDYPTKNFSSDNPGKTSGGYMKVGNSRGTSQQHGKKTVGYSK